MLAKSIRLANSLVPPAKGEVLAKCTRLAKNRGPPAKGEMLAKSIRLAKSLGLPRKGEVLVKSTRLAKSFRLAKSICLAEFAKSFRLGGSFVKDMIVSAGGRSYPRRSRSCCRADSDVLLTAQS